MSRLGDRTGWSFLVDLARRADSRSSIWAAATIAEHDRRLGLEQHILEEGSPFEVRWGMVERLGQVSGLDHVWTADGLAESCRWVEHQRQQEEARSAS